MNQPCQIIRARARKYLKCEEPSVFVEIIIIKARAKQESSKDLIVFQRIVIIKAWAQKWKCKETIVFLEVIIIIIPPRLYIFEMFGIL